jgi:hypothetical protein
MSLKEGDVEIVVCAAKERAVAIGTSRSTIRSREPIGFADRTHEPMASSAN